MSMASIFSGQAGFNVDPADAAFAWASFTTLAMTVAIALGAVGFAVDCQMVGVGYTFWVLAVLRIASVLAFVPLLAVHGVESALVLGLLLPPWVAATAARYTERNRSTRGIDLMLRAVGAGLLVWAVPVVPHNVAANRTNQAPEIRGELIDMKQKFGD